MGVDGILLIISHYKTLLKLHSMRSNKKTLGLSLIVSWIIAIMFPHFGSW